MIILPLQMFSAHVPSGPPYLNTKACGFPLVEKADCDNGRRRWEGAVTHRNGAARARRSPSNHILYGRRSPDCTSDTSLPSERSPTVMSSPTFPEETANPVMNDVGADIPA